MVPVYAFPENTSGPQLNELAEKSALQAFAEADWVSEPSVTYTVKDATLFL